MTIRPPNNAEYLGDGAYASFDVYGQQFVLWAERDNGWNYICLEPSMLDALVAYSKRLMEAARRTK